MEEKYQLEEHTVYKALMRPVLYLGLPMELLFVVISVPLVIGLQIKKPIILLLIPALVFLLGLFTKKDPFTFHLLILKWKMAKKYKRYRIFGTQAVFARKYTANCPIGISKVQRCKK